MASAALKVGVVGATGMVGESFMALLSRQDFANTLSIDELRPFASEKSVGTSVQACGRSWPVQVLSEGCFKGLDLVFFSSGDDISREWAPKAVAAGAFAVDNSAAFRMSDGIPLVVPEVNGHLLPAKNHPALIANPNCSTIQLVVALHALQDFGLEDVTVATYQAVSGAGKAGADELLAQTKAMAQDQKLPAPEAFPHQIALNCIPQIGSFNEDGYCSEEMKIIRETKKILGQPALPVSAFTVRVPALNAHSEAVWVRFKKAPSKAEVLAALENGKGIRLLSQATPEDYPTALTASGQDPVYVGRVHQDLEDSHRWLMWVVADNIRKGAALNGLQIAQAIFN